MNILTSLGRFCTGLLFLTFVWIATSIRLIASQAPSITSLHPLGTNVVIEVTIPSGLRKVTLQSRTRIGAGSWVPRAVARLHGDEGTLKFELPNRRDLELIRVVADETEPLPANFYEGTNSFPGIVSSSNGGILYTRGDGSAITDDTATPGANPTGTFPGTSPRSVAESDIWKVAEERVYFFNVLRGLQVIDIHEPDAPVLQSTLSIPAAGEQMYLMQDNVVVLLVQAGCYWGAQKSQVILASTQEPQSRVITSLGVDGYITESRLVGTALYVASQTYRDTVEKGVHTYTSGIVVSSFDLADPLHPVVRDTLWYPGYNSVVSATETLLFVVSQSPSDWTRSVINTIDITSPDGKMSAYVSIQPAGTVRDKFKMDYQGTRFTCVSEEFKDARQVRLETFFLADPRSAGPIALRKTGDLKIADRETVFATRFDGDKAYIVTFLRIDPLFVIDLSDAANPRIAGELKVPGWSTYIQPMGDRLVAVGTESNRVAVSLFDVSNPARPGLLSRVLLGNSYSWSESAYNEKAVTILPEDKLILVPYSGDTTSGYASRVQLIDLERDHLTLRGVIERPIEPRRAALHLNRIYTISSRELLAVDASNRDEPMVKNSVDLSWSVDQLFLQGDYLIELSSQSVWWANQTRTQLRVARSTAADRAVATLTLSNLPIVGATLRNGRLYLAQANVQNSFWWWGAPMMAAEQTATKENPNSTGLVTVIDVRDPLIPRIEGQSELGLAASGLGRNWQPLWLGDELLVWYAKAGFYGWPMALDAVNTSAVNTGAFPGWGWGWGTQGPTLIAVDVRDPAKPAQKSELTLEKQDWWGVGDAYSAGHLVYFSHLRSEPMQDAGEKKEGSDTVMVPAPLWRQRDFLDVIDYEDPKSPEVRDPVSLPGALQGLGRGGDLLYTLNQPLDEKGNQTMGMWLTALSFDGVSAHQIDSVILDKTWMPSVLVSGDSVFVSLPAIDLSGALMTGTLDTWSLSAEGKLDRLARFELLGTPRQVVQRGALLTVLDNANRAVLLDATHPTSLRQVGSTSPGGCFWGDASKGDGALDKGFWIPLADYGVLEVPRAP